MLPSKLLLKPQYSTGCAEERVAGLLENEQHSEMLPKVYLNAVSEQVKKSWWDDECCEYRRVSCSVSAKEENEK